MPLFSGLPFFYVRPQDAQSDGRTQAALSRGLDRAFQERGRREALAQRRREFDAEQPLREANMNLQEARVTQMKGEISDRATMASWMNQVAKNPDSINTLPEFNTLAGMEGAAKFQNMVLTRRGQLSGLSSSSAFMSMFEGLNNVDKAEVMQVVSEDGGMTPKAWKLLTSKTAATPQQSGALTTGAKTALYTRALWLEQKSGMQVVPRNPDGSISATEPIDMEVFNAAAEKVTSRELGGQATKARLEALKDIYKQEVRSIHDRANAPLLPDFKISGGREVDNDAVNKAIEQAMKTHMDRVDNLLKESPPPAIDGDTRTLEDFTGRNLNLEAPAPQLQDTNATKRFRWNPDTGTFSPVP